ncbi:MAG: phenylalanine--tRNA ligase subunit alpha [Deltaproteobacteria bacterium]|nr:phenylalanine--tRNA ligase subunit alpha [Deltaproteobacteria bacterium]
MRERLKKLEDEALKDIELAADKENLLSIKTRYLGRKGKVVLFIKEISNLPLDERPAIGNLANSVKSKIEEKINLLLDAVLKQKKLTKLLQEGIDVSLPGRHLPVGHIHPVTRVTEEIKEVFADMGFLIAEGPEIETDYYNFEALNIPKDHPARDMQDTFYIGDDLLLRTHTSPVQIRVMEKQRPPLKVIAPGTVYRRDSDITHTPMFHQVEGFMVDEGITFGDLKGVLTVFLHKIFNEDAAIRFRPSFFPFTEPSAEVDIQCVMCKGNGCRVCKMSGWLEILGAGMIHPEVFKAVNYDYEKYSGFAFGLGIERIAMLKFGIDDIRLFFENDVRFLRQF